MRQGAALEIIAAGPTGHLDSSNGGEMAAQSLRLISDQLKRIEQRLQLGLRVLLQYRHHPRPRICRLREGRAKSPS